MHDIIDTEFIPKDPGNGNKHPGSPALRGGNALSPQQITKLEHCEQTIKTLHTTIMENIWYTGEQLAQAQDVLRHNKDGGFIQWAEQTFGWSKRTIYNYLNVYKRFPTVQRVTQLGITQKSLYALAADSTPEEARQEVLERIEAGEQLTFQDVEDTCQSWKVKQHRRTMPSTPSTPPPQPVPQTLCYFCGQPDITVYPKDRSGIGIGRECGCLQKAITYFNDYEGTKKGGPWI